jgi:hypothetical protein
MKYIWTLLLCLVVVKWLYWLHRFFNYTPLWWQRRVSRNTSNIIYYYFWLLPTTFVAVALLLDENIYPYISIMRVWTSWLCLEIVAGKWIHTFMRKQPHLITWRKAWGLSSWDNYLLAVLCTRMLLFLAIFLWSAAIFFPYTAISWVTLLAILSIYTMLHPSTLVVTTILVSSFVLLPPLVLKYKIKCSYQQLYWTLVQAWKSDWNLIFYRIKKGYTEWIKPSYYEKKKSAWKACLTFFTSTCWYLEVVIIILKDLW